MKICSSLNLGLAAAAAFGAGVILDTGCSNLQAENTYGLSHCGALGLLKIQELLFPKDSDQMSEFGDAILLNHYNTSSEKALENFKTRYPDTINWFEEGTDTSPCLNTSESHAFYSTMVDKIYSFAQPFISKRRGSFADPDTCIDVAAGTFYLQSKAKEMTRNKMCDQKVIKVLEARDQVEYGIEKPDFSHIVGQYGATIVKRCEKLRCDVKSTICDAILRSSQKANSLFNWVFGLSIH